jgi:hypothetical protein
METSIPIARSLALFVATCAVLGCSSKQAETGADTATEVGPDTSKPEECGTTTEPYDVPLDAAVDTVVDDGAVVPASCEACVYGHVCSCELRNDGGTMHCNTCPFCL